MTESALTRPFKLGLLELRNRVVMAPMTRSFSPNHIPGEDVAAYYRRRAEGGVGLVVTEGTYPGHPSSGDCTHVPNLSDEAALAGWKRVVSGVHAARAKIAAQLWHIGMRRPTKRFPDPSVVLIGPSGLASDGTALGEPMSVDVIKAVIESYGRAAANAKAVGFDAVELHGGHGYLIDQFFWDKTNKRTDIYGGDLVGRTRFAVEVIAEVRRAVGPDFPISFRYSQWKIPFYTVRLAETPQELERFLAPLTRAGVDIFSCSTRRYWEPEFPDSDLNLAGWTKKLTGKPTITVGSVGLNKALTDQGPAEPSNIDKLEEMMARGDFDLVAVARAMLADPNWYKKILIKDYKNMIAYHADLEKTLF